MTLSARWMQCFFGNPGESVCTSLTCLGSMPIFGAKSRAMRGCASKLACGRRIDPADCTVYTEICGEFVIFPAGR